MTSIARSELVTAITSGVAASTTKATGRDSVVKSSVVNHVRTALKQTLEGRFEKFVKRASTADMYFLNAVLDIHNSESLGVGASTAELMLPAAFEAQTNADIPCFVAVPDHFKGEVEQFVNVLTADAA